MVEKYRIESDLFKKLSGKCRLNTILTIIDTNPNIKLNCLCVLAKYRALIFEKLLEDNFFNYDDIIECIRLVPDTLLYVRKFLRKDGMFRKKFLQALEPEWYDYLPYDLAVNPEIMERCGRTSKIFIDDEIDLDDNSWVDRNGKLIVFFKLKADFPIKSKADYYRLYREYIESKLSIRGFCDVYGITPEDGFIEFLDRIKSESYVASSEIDDVKYIVQRKFYMVSSDTAKRLANGDLSFEEFFENESINFKFSDIDLYYKTLTLEERNNFSLKLMDYFDHHTPLLLNTFIEFLTTSKHNALENYNFFVKGNLKAPKDINYYRKYHDQLTKLKHQFSTYYRKNMYCTYGIDDKSFEVDDDVIDQAYAYALDNKIHISNYSISYLCKQIAIGNLEYSKEAKEQKDEIIDVIVNLIIEEKTMEDYISTMKSLKLRV